MGARSSTPRTVQIENDSSVNVIEVSDAVVDRLKGLHTKDVAEQNEHDRKVAAAAVAAARIQWEKQQQQPQHQLHSAPKQSTSPITSHLATSLTALEVHRQKEDELRKNDAYWQDRLVKQEKDLKKTASTLEKEYNETLSEVRKRFDNSAPQYRLPPCKDIKAMVVECYQVNAKQTLMCSNVVTDFEQCVQLHRSNLLNEKYGLNKQPIAAAS